MEWFLPQQPHATSNRLTDRQTQTPQKHRLATPLLGASNTNVSYPIHSQQPRKTRLSLELQAQLPIRKKYK